MPSPAEQRIARRGTLDFIAFDPITVILNHASTVPTDAGGFIKQAPMAREPAIGRLIDTPGGVPVIRRQVDGEEVEVTQELVLPWNTVAERGDWFFVGGRKYEVVWVPNGVTRDYELKLGVAYRG